MDQLGIGKKNAVIPHTHKIAHNLKKAIERVHVKVVFSALEKLGNLCKITVPAYTPKRERRSSHQKKPVDCADNVVYRIPLSCDTCYIGKTGPLHKWKAEGTQVQCRPHKTGMAFCPLLRLWMQAKIKKNGIVAKHRDRVTREIIEAAEILRLKDGCVSGRSHWQDRYLGLSPRWILWGFVVAICAWLVCYCVTV